MDIDMDLGASSSNIPVEIENEKEIKNKLYNAYYEPKNLQELIDKHYLPILELLQEDAQKQQTKYFLYQSRPFYLSLKKIEVESEAVCAYGIDAQIFELLNKRNELPDEDIYKNIQIIIRDQISLLLKSPIRSNSFVLTKFGTFSEMLMNEMTAKIYYNYVLNKSPSFHSHSYYYEDEDEDDEDEDEDLEEEEEEEYYYQNRVFPKGSCRYGLQCYRKNPQHFLEFYHPEGHPKAPPSVIRTSASMNCYPRNLYPHYYY